MSKARRSVSPEVVQQYDEFTAKIKQQWDTESTGSSTYDYDKASAEQAREDSLIEAGAA
jgi:transitional endoplasmic reticulum ATPase